MSRASRPRRRMHDVTPGGRKVALPCAYCQRKNTQEIIPLLQSFTFYGTAFPEPTTIGPQADTAGRNLTSVIIGTYKLYHLPEISNYSDTFGDTNDFPQ